MNTKLFINGEFQETSVKEKIYNPANAELVAEVASAGAREVDAALNAARQSFDQGLWSRLPFSERKQFLAKIAQGILDSAADLARLETLNTGKPIKESTFMDIPSAAKTFEYAANSLERYFAAESIEISPEAHSTLVREPYGVACLIVPWNYPLLIACWKLASALAAGNTVVLKPSSLTPLTALALADIVHDAGLPEGVVNIINGPGATIGEVLCSDKRVDMISFTGSSSVGRSIIGASAASTKKLLMELGGKSAGIILKDADMELAVNGSLCSIFLNQGQMCTAMSRLLVEDDVYDAFISDFTAKAKRINLGDGLNYETQMGPLISQGQLWKILAYVGKARAENARVICGGEIPNAPGLKKGFFFEPTVIVDVTPEMSIFKEEIFGPVVCVLKFSDVKEAIALANKTEYGLAAAVWSKNASLAQETASKINAGVVWINTYGMFYNEVPYGGFKQSGFGKELGREGFLEYSRLKNIVVDRTADAKPLVNYWYGF